MGELPFPVDDSKCNVLVRRARAELQNDGLIVAGFLDDLVCGCLRLVNKVGVEYVELEHMLVYEVDSKPWHGVTLYPCTTFGGGLSVLPPG